jgi:protein gp37
VAQKFKIEWTDSTWNPIRGCSMAKGSELGGCLNCYAARLNARNLPNLKSPATGESFARILDSGPRWTGRIELIPSTLHLPLRWKEPQRIFVNSQSDLFHKDLSFEDIDLIMAVMGMAQQHTFKVLTKRPEVAFRYYASRTEEWAREHFVP